MTMFRRIFNNQLNGQEIDMEAPTFKCEPDDPPPAPPSLPSQLNPPEKLSLPEMVQTRQTETAPSSTGDDNTVEVDQRMVARAAEAHAQMQNRELPKPANHTGEAQARPVPVKTQAEGAAPSHRTGRARTRLIGFDTGAEATADPIAHAQAGPSTEERINPAGWVAITTGPGRGQHFAIYGGVVMVGRGEDQGIRLDFGDQAISRQNHAALAYDTEDNKFYLGHGGKSNIIKLNGRPVLSTEEVVHGDAIRIGETTLRFVALCGESFQWGDTSNA